MVIKLTQSRLESILKIKKWSECECGNPKERGATGCIRCNALEYGNHTSAARTTGRTETHDRVCDIKPNLDAFLRSRGLNTIPFNR